MGKSVADLRCEEKINQIILFIRFEMRIRGDVAYFVSHFFLNRRSEARKTLAMNIIAFASKFVSRILLDLTC